MLFFSGSRAVARKRTRSREMSATYSIMLWGMSLMYDANVSGVR